MVSTYKDTYLLNITNINVEYSIDFDCFYIKLIIYIFITYTKPNQRYLY